MIRNYKLTDARRRRDFFTCSRFFCIFTVSDNKVRAFGAPSDSYAAVQLHASLPYGFVFPNGEVRVKY